MKTLIVYASKYGCTEDCVVYLKKKLHPDTKLLNLKHVGNVDLQNFERALIGGSIYVGKIQKEVKHFCEKNEQMLLRKQIVLFMCCTTPEQTNEFFKNNFPAPLINHAVDTVNFGGELRPQKMNFFDKKITNMISKTEPKKVEILYKNIDLLADRLLTSS